MCRCPDASNLALLAIIVEASYFSFFKNVSRTNTAYMASMHDMTLIASRVITNSKYHMASLLGLRRKETKKTGVGVLVNSVIFIHSFIRFGSMTS
jgi:hypothetical protein